MAGTGGGGGGLVRWKLDRGLLLESPSRFKHYWAQYSTALSKSVLKEH